MLAWAFESAAAAAGAAPLRPLLLGLLLPLRLLTLQLEMCTRLCYTSTVAVQKMILIINRESNFLGGLYDPSSSGLSFVEKQKTSE